jgi:AcrR family transcriptional regulator
MEKGDILKGCRNLFGRWGVHSVTMADVARYLGISKKTLYKVYENKDAIVTDVVRKLVEENKAELNSRMACEQTLTNRLSVFNNFIVNRAVALRPVLLYDIRKYYPSAYHLVKQHRHEIVIYLKDLLVEGQRSGVIRSNIDPVLSAEFRIDVLEWDIMEAERDTMPIEVKQSQFFDLMLNGLKLNQNLKSSENSG